MAETESWSAETRVHRALSDPSRLGILRRLRQAEEPLDAQTIARTADLHLSTVRAHLAVLSEAGLVTRTEKRGSRGRPRMLYTPTDTPPGGSDAYQLLARALASHIATTETHPEASAERAGREWGAHLAPRPAPFTHPTTEQATDQLLHLHERLGFHPALDHTPNEDRILIRSCPFEELARAYQSVVCPFHTGLITGTLTGIDSTLRVRVEPFAQPGTCIAHLKHA